MNTRLKQLIESALTASGFARLYQGRLRRSAALVLAYHDIVPTGDKVVGDASLHLPQRDFARQLDLVARTHAVVPLASIFDEQSEAPRVAITFDDAYSGALTAGVEELRSRNLAATVFVAPALFGQATWWDQLSTDTSGGVPERTRDHALWQLEGLQENILSDAPSSPVRSGAELPRIATLEEVRDATAYPGLSIASHTWSHPNLAALGPADLARELARPLEWLNANFPLSLPMVAYPYGLYSADVERAAATAGYARGFRVDGGWIGETASLNPFAIPRYNVPAGLSLAGFRLRLAGIGTSA